MTAKRFHETLYAYRYAALPLAIPFCFAVASFGLGRSLQVGVIAVVLATLAAMFIFWFPTKGFKVEYYRPKYKMTFERAIFSSDRDEKAEQARLICERHGFDHMAVLDRDGQGRTIWFTHEEDYHTVKLTL